MPQGCIFYKNEEINRICALLLCGTAVLIFKRLFNQMLIWIRGYVFFLKQIKKALAQGEYTVILL